MNIIPWKKELETGIKLIDEQHMEFIKRANAFFIKVRADRQKDAAREQLEFLQNYILYHFQAEETFQVESDYPGYLCHQAEHKSLVFKVKEMSIMLNTSNFSKESVDSFCAFITNWVITHILNYDLGFAKYYKEFLKKSADG